MKALLSFTLRPRIVKDTLKAEIKLRTSSTKRLIAEGEAIVYMEDKSVLLDDDFSNELNDMGIDYLGVQETLEEDFMMGGQRWNLPRA